MADDVEMNDATNAPHEHSELLAVSELLQTAGERKPSELELKLVNMILSSPPKPSDLDDKSLFNFLHVVLETSVKWKQQDLLDRTIKRFEQLGTLVVEPKLACDMLRAFSLETVRPCLEQMVQCDTSRTVHESFSFLQSLEFLVAESEIESAEGFPTWAAGQRLRLYQALPAPLTEHEEVIQHCLKFGGWGYMQDHVIPLYTMTKARHNSGIFLCELALQADSDKSLPDVPLKSTVISAMLRAGIGGFRSLPVRSCVTRIDTAFATLRACFKYRCLDQLDSFFSGLVKAIDNIGDEDALQSVSTKALYPFLTRLTTDLTSEKAYSPALIQPHIDTLVASTVKAILRFLKAGKNQWDKRIDSTDWIAFEKWLKPLLTPKIIFPVFLRKVAACCGKPSALPEMARACLRLFHTHFKGYIKQDTEFIKAFQSLSDCYAASTNALDAASIIEDIVFLGAVIDVPSSLVIFAKRLVTPEALQHSGSCAQVTLDKPYDPSEECYSSDHAVDLRIIVKDVSRQVKDQHAFSRVSPALAIIVRSWFTTHLLEDPPKQMPNALRNRLDGLLVKWKCNKSHGRALCELLRDFTCALIYRGGEWLYLPDTGQRISNHLLDHLREFVPQDVAAWGRDNDGVVWVHKKIEATWEPAHWPELQAYGKRMLEDITTNQDRLREVLGKDYQRLYDAVYKPRPVSAPEDAEVTTDADEGPEARRSGSVEGKAANEEVSKLNTKDKAREGSSEEEGGGEGAGGAEGGSNTKAIVPSTVVSTRCTEDDAVGPPLKRKKTN